MIKSILHKTLLIAIVSLAGLAVFSIAPNISVYENRLPTAFADTSSGDTLAFPFEDNSNNPFDNGKEGGMYLSTPSNIQQEVEFNPETGQYDIKQKLGDSLDFRPTQNSGLEEYLDYNMENSKKDYWRAKSEEQAKSLKGSLKPELDIKNETVDKIFGGSAVNIKPSGSAELKFGVKVNSTKNPQISERNQRTAVFDFDQKIQLNVVGTVGDKLKLATNYNTESTFEFQNQMKLEYAGGEDEIIKKIEAGNVSLPLTGSLITGSQTLFGIKTQLQFGRLMVTSVLSQQKGNKSEIEVKGGAQIQEFEVRADSYEQNQHFFLGHYFRDQYEEALSTPPIVNSQVNITRIEVWVTNNNNATENTRNVIGFQDLGEQNSSRIYNPQRVQVVGLDSFPDNDANNLYSQLADNANVRNFVSSTSALAQLNMVSKRDFQKIELGRKLNENEYFVHPQLGYISLRQQLNTNQMLAVAYQYTYRGQTYQVGEFSTDIQGQDVLMLRMLKSTERNTHAPMWDLMMKNIYATGAYNVQKDGFKLEVWYLNANTGIENNFLPEGRIKEKQLLGIVGLDRLTGGGNRGQDGVFDYLDNPRITIIPQNGRIIFPVLEPFGGYLREQFQDDKLADKYVFDSLYTTTQANAKVKFPSRNRFIMKGETKSSSGSEISLGAINVPQGSVVVTSGGVPLVENSDYIVDYNLGRVTIINQSVLESGTPIKVSLESQELFNIQQKTLLASRFDYTVSDDFVLGGTIMNLSEKPVTPKTNFGDEPMNNTIVGVDGSYKTDSPFLTTLVDKIPLIETKEKSTITVSGEVAKLFPGHSRALGDDGTSYVDDFEGSQTSINIMAGSINSWVMASTPQGQPSLFPEGNLINDPAYGFNRAKLAWYVLDPLFFPGRKDKNIPENVENDQDMTSNHFMREVPQSEVFPSKDPDYGSFNNIATFDLSFYPEERGPYNFDVDGKNEKGVQYGHGINEDGSLKNPEDRWGGIMRRIETNDFDAANVEFIQFWMMDPFAEMDNGDFPGQGTNGKLYFNIGEISEDILRDGQKTFEQGMPTNEQESNDISDSLKLTGWGRIPAPGTQAIVQAFVNDPQARPFQDVGLDGLSNNLEGIYFKDLYLDKIESTIGTGSEAYNKAVIDPSGDDYNFYRDDEYDNAGLSILERYKKYNGMEGNSATSEIYKTQNTDGYPTTSSQRPDAEDINNDNTLDDAESYYQYSIDISPNAVNENNVGRNYITDVLQTRTPTTNGQNRPIKWYQFKIPIKDFEKAVGGISDFRSIRFMRIFMKGFEKPVYLRFARLELVRGEWRRYTDNLESSGEQLNEESFQDFNIGAVNIEENSERIPVNYVLPPGLAREVNFGTQNLQRLNEQSMALQVCNLEDGSSNAAYKNTLLDMRRYKRIKMYVHAEERNETELLDDDLSVFVRIGTDFEENYYEYEKPIKVSPEGRYATEIESDQLMVWPEANNIDLALEDLWGLKMERNRLIIDNPQEMNVTQVYSGVDAQGAKISIVGNPNMAEVKTIMIGVRNPRALTNPNSDDGLPKCAEVWVNELRLSEFDKNGGWAAVGRVTANLADFANISLSGSIKTPGFGSVEQKINERQKEKIQTMDASATFQLGKFLPEEFGLRVPMYVGYSEMQSIPEFSPLAEDIPSKVYENEFPGLETKAQRDSLKDIIRDKTTRKSINFTNVKKEKSGGKDSKKHIYDISNFSTTYAYTEENHTNFELEKDIVKNYRGSLNYNFGANPKNLKPFSKVKALRKSKYLRIIKDFNFYPWPKQYSFRTDINRMYSERVIRNVTPNVTASLPKIYNQNFNWGRTYGLKYDLSKALKMSFDATNNSFVEELNSARVFDKELEVDSFQIFKQNVQNSLLSGGENMNYRHNIGVNYKLPLNKIPLTNWINSTASYNTSYNWQRAPLAAEHFGNNIQNSRKVNGNATFNMITLYNKVGYLKKVNQRMRKAGKSKAKAKPAKGKGKNEKEEDDPKKKKKNGPKPTDYVVKFLMGVRNFNASYTATEGIFLPGYDRDSRLMGMSNGFEAPGYGFILGQQEYGSDEENFATYASERDWLMREETINQQYAETFTESINLKSSIQPFKDFNIDLSSNTTTATNNSEFYRWQGEDDDRWLSETKTFTGNYSSTIVAASTAFIDANEDGTSDLFTQMLENRVIISERLASGNDLSNGLHGTETEGAAGFQQGYGATSTDVLIPAFLAAYTGQDAGEVGLDPLNVGYKNKKFLPLPNWRVRYNGLSKMDFVKKYFKTVTLNHSYKSSYNVSGYQTNLNRDKNNLGETDVANNFHTEYIINTVTISEQFSPLINVDVTFHNSLQARFEIKKDRNLAMSMTNSQLTEVNGKEYVLGIGYTIQQVKLPFELRPGTPVQSDLKLRLDFAIRDNVTTIRKVVENTHQQTAGQKQISVKATADYQLSKALRLRGYYDYAKSIPYISTSFETSNMNAGVSILFTLGL